MQFKRILSLTMVFVLSLAAFSGCKKSDGDEYSEFVSYVEVGGGDNANNQKDSKGDNEADNSSTGTSGSGKTNSGSGKTSNGATTTKNGKVDLGGRTIIYQSLKRVAVTVKTHIGRRKQSLRRSIISNSSMFQATTIIFMIRLLRVLLPASPPAILCPQSKLRFPQ